MDVPGATRTAVCVSANDERITATAATPEDSISKYPWVQANVCKLGQIGPKNSIHFNSCTESNATNSTDVV